MDLFLIRHVAAAPGDEPRAITPRGRARFAPLRQTLRRSGLRFHRLIHSPLLRAVETAELLTDLADDSEVSMLLGCEPGDALLAMLQGLPEGGDGTLGLVGHSPWLERLLALLVLGNADAAGAFDLRKGGVAWLVGRPEPGAMRLSALLAPKLFRRGGVGHRAVVSPSPPPAPPAPRRRRSG